jgi:hypothetical protein
MKFIKLFFIVMLILSACVCFAGPVEEWLWLHDEILVPIQSNFNDSSSSTKLISMELIRMQKEDGVIINEDNIKQMLSLAIENLKNKKKWDPKHFMGNIRNVCGVCNHGQTEAECAADILQTAWQNKISNCGEYADLVMIALEFNRMNYMKNEGKSFIFRNAVYVKAYTGTGDHELVLVEGISGAMFAVDPWIWKVEKLDNFPKLSEIKYVNLNDSANQKLNSLFGELYNGKKYYDVKYVNESTMWVLHRERSQDTQRYVSNYDPGMKVFYETPRSDGRPKFRSWTTKYDELVPKLPTPGTSEPEHKKPENDGKK